MKYAITVDAGKDTTKAIGSWIDENDKLVNKEVSFPTRYYDLSNGDIEAQGNSFHIFCDGKECVIGDSGEVYDSETTKTTFLHKAAIYTAISQLLVPTDEDAIILLTVGCPTTIFRNKKLKEEFRNYIELNHEITVGQIKYNFDFQKIIIKNEGSGIVYLEPDLFIEKRVAVFDLGGKQFNFGIFDNRVLVPSSSFSNNHGGTLLQTLVKQEININFGFDIDLATSKKAIEQGGLILNGKLSEDSTLVVSKTIKRFINDFIIKDLQENNISIGVLSAIAIGGTSSIIIDYLKEVFPHITVPSKASSIKDYQWANARGFHIVCLVKAGMINGW